MVSCRDTSIPGSWWRTAVVARNDKIVLAKNWGVRDREKQLPLEDDTIFRIYSMTKPITSVAAMMLVEQGKMALDDPIAKYLPQLAERKVMVEENENGGTTTKEVPAEREITVRRLAASHIGIHLRFLRKHRSGQTIQERHWC